MVQTIYQSVNLVLLFSLFVVDKLCNEMVVWTFEGTEEWVPCLRIEFVSDLFISCGSLVNVCQPIWRSRRDGFHYYPCQFSHWFGLVWLDAWLQLALMYTLFLFTSVQNGVCWTIPRFCSSIFLVILDWCLEGWIQGVVSKAFS